MKVNDRPVQDLWVTLDPSQQESATGGLKNFTNVVEQIFIEDGSLGNSGGTADILSGLLKFTSFLDFNVDVGGGFGETPFLPTLPTSPFFLSFL